jgi:cobalt-zinc-cadmium efflux system membrane fusion protein
VPFTRCIACHPELTGADPADWCKEHGVPESKCTVCHPELLKTGVADDWCKEHGVPESCCTICHPEIAHRSDAAPADDGPEVTAAETAAQTSGAPAPTPGKDPRTCQKHALKVQFASTAAIDKAGVRLGVVTERRMAESIAAPASVEYDRAHHANVVARVAGIVRFVDRPPGAGVAAGDLLAVVDAAEIGRAKSELLAADSADRAAQAAWQRIARSVELGTRSEAEGNERAATAAAAAVRLYDARQALQALGLPPPDGPLTPASVARLGLPEAVLDGAADRQSANLLPVRAPIDGVVVARDVVAGEAVAAGAPLFAIADMRRLAVRIDLPEASAGRAVVGAHVLFRPQSAPDLAYAGAIDWIATALDEHTRTLQLRALVDNADGALRVHAFGTAQVVIRAAATAIAVPNAAVQWEGCCYVVFVRIADTVFQPRKVRLGTRDAACTEILVGLLPGEVIATTGSGVLTAAIQASNLGAGCCGDR